MKPFHGNLYIAVRIHDEHSARARHIIYRYAKDFAVSFLLLFFSYEALPKCTEQKTTAIHLV